MLQAKRPKKLKGNCRKFNKSALPAHSSSLFDGLSHSTDNRLVSRANLDAIRTLVGTLPQVQLGCLECRLQAEDDRIDYQVCPFLGEEEYTATLEYLQQEAQGTAEVQVIWKALYRFCHQLIQSPFARGAISNIWLVYDILDPQKPIEVPWIYAGLLDNPIDNDINTELAKQVLQLYPQDNIPLLTQQLDELHAILPQRAYICAIGFMQVRGVENLRVALKFQQLDEVAAFLDKAGWGGSMDFIAANFSSLLASDTTISLAIDFSERVQPVIGMEHYMGVQGSSTRLPGYLAEMVEAGYCAAPKAEAMLEWSSAKPGDALSRWVNHFKYVFDEEGLRQTKGYLFFR